MSLADWGKWARDKAKQIKDFLFAKKNPVTDAALNKVRALFTATVFSCFNLSREPTARPYTGKKWKPLKIKVHREPLIKTGVMYASAVRSTGAAVITEGVLRIAMDTPFYAKYQNYGTRRIPARAFFGIDEAYYKEIEENIGKTTMEILVS